MLLSRAANVVLYAVDKCINILDAACVSAAVAPGVTSMSAPVVTEGIEGAL